MPRRPISAANWKMHKRSGEAAEFCKALAEIDPAGEADIVIAAGFLQLPVAAAAFATTRIRAAAQNMHHADSGAFTGEVSPAQAAEFADWVILGHSERRQYFCEDEIALEAKLAAAKRHGLAPILCIGENQAERDEGRTDAVLNRQLAILGPDSPDDLVIAYEPVWAIGSGEPATPETAQETAAAIRAKLAALIGPDRADATRILYGGSVKPGNIADFMAQPDVDGALVGGASLDLDAFSAITRAIAAA